MWAASPARYRRPCCIGSATKLRMPVTPFSRIGPSASVQPRRAEPRLQLGPDALVGPLGDVLVVAHLEVEAAERRRAQAEQREAALVVRVDELVARRRRRRRGCRASRTGSRARTIRSTPAGIDGRRHAVEAVAAGDRRRRRARARAPSWRNVIAGPVGRRASCSATSATSNSSGSPGLEPEPRSDPSPPRSGRRSRSPRRRSARESGIAVALAVELQLDAVVDDALAIASARRRRIAAAGRPCPARARPRGCAART